MNNPDHTLIDRIIGPLTILFGKDMGKYPHGNALHIRGNRHSAIIDPNLGLVARKPHIPHADMVIHSHAHEDHVSGSHLYPHAKWYVHQEDLPGLRSLDGLMDIYGFPEPERSRFAGVVEKDFYFMAREDAIPFEDGWRVDLGGVIIETIHTPGHTRGHCCFLVEWEGSSEKLVYLGDIELTGFGPYYGDAWSSLESFESSLEKLKDIDAHWWLTFHHKGLIESRDRFLEMLNAFQSVIKVREERLLDFLIEPRNMPEIVQYRHVYRPGVEGDMYDLIEKRSMTQHLIRLIKEGKVVESEGIYSLA